MKLFVWRLCMCDITRLQCQIFMPMPRERQRTGMKTKSHVEHVIEIFCCFERGVAYICAINAWSLHFIQFNMNYNFILRKMESTKFQTYYNQHTKTLTTHFPTCNKEFMTPLQEYFVTEWFIMTVELRDSWVTGAHKNSWHVSGTFSWVAYKSTLFEKKFNNFIH